MFSFPIPNHRDLVPPPTANGDRHTFEQECAASVAASLYDIAITLRQLVKQLEMAQR